MLGGFGISMYFCAMNPETYHIPVLLTPSVEGLAIRPEGTYVDVTLGGGGHSREILKHLKGGRLFSFDQDADAINRVKGDPRWTLIHSNFRYLKNWMRYYGVDAIDGLLADLGVSSHHFDTPQRGFSFRSEAPLDMRMNQQAQLTAADVLNTYSREQLTSIFRLYGELRQSGRISSAVTRARTEAPIETTSQLAELLIPLLGHDRERKDLARAFQALRIEVNGEMSALEEMLASAIELLRPGGRLVVISYHSLEDRIVKNMMRAGNINGKVESDLYGRTKAPMRAVEKAITPTPVEMVENPRSRSARLRIAEKIG